MDLYCFDFHGGYLGRLADGGVFFDSRGSQRGRLAAGDGMYDLDGGYMGRIDVQGSFFAADGTCRGYIRDWNGSQPPQVARVATHVALTGYDLSAGGIGERYN